MSLEVKVFGRDGDRRKVYLYGPRDRRHVCIVEDGYKYYTFVDDDFTLEGILACERTRDELGDPTGYGLYTITEPTRYDNPLVKIRGFLSSEGLPLECPEMYGLVDDIFDLTTELQIDGIDQYDSYADVKNAFDEIAKKAIDNNRKLERLKGRDVYDLVVEIDGMSNDLLDTKYERQIAELERDKLKKELEVEKAANKRLQEQIKQVESEKNELLKDRDEYKSKLLTKIKEYVVTL